MVRVKESYGVEKKGTGRADHLSKSMSFSADPTDIWGNIVSLGNAELAARLGSINTFDRRGNIIWMDDFESGVLHWSEQGDGEGKAAVLTTLKALTGGQCCKVTSGSTDIRRGQIRRWLVYPIRKKIGFELSATQPANLASMQIKLTVYDGVHAHVAKIRYFVATTTLEYGTGDVAYTPFATIGELVQNDDVFLRWKLVADFEAEKFVRLILNEKEYDMSIYPYYKVEIDTRPHLRLDYAIWADSAVNISSYVDDAILTQNEP